MLPPCPICTAPTPQELIAAGVALRDGDPATAEPILARARLATAALAADAAGRPDAADAAMLWARAATDTGRRTDLDEVIAALGYDRAELEAEPGDDEEPR
jgi:hypothetical protein